MGLVVGEVPNSGYMLRFTQEYSCLRISIKPVDKPEDRPQSHRQPPGDNNSILHLKIRRQVIAHGRSPPPIVVLAYFPRRSGNISLLKKVANARRRNIGFCANYQRRLSQRRKISLLAALFNARRARKNTAAVHCELCSSFFYVPDVPGGGLLFVLITQQQ